MAPVKLIFEVTTQMVLDENKKLQYVDINLDFSSNIDKTRYFNGDIPNKDGCSAAITTLTQGIVAIMLSAHNSGMLDSAQTLRKVISDLENGFVQVADTTVEEFKNLNKL